MVKFLALPADICLVILNTLEAEKSAASRHALLNLGLTQKRMFSVVKPILYREVVIGEGHQLPAFALLVFRDPDSAALVQSFECHDCDAESSKKDDQTLQEWRNAREYETAWEAKPRDERSYPFFQDRGWPAGDDLEKVLRARVGRIARDGEDAEKWYNAVRFIENEDAVVALLLSSLPHVRRIILEPQCLQDWQYTLRVIKSAGDCKKREQARYLNEVKEAKFYGIDNKYPNGPGMFASYLRLPSIQRVYGWDVGHCEQDEMSDEIAALQPKASCVTDLELAGRSKLWAPDLKHLLQVPERLEKFTYRIGNTWAWYPARTDDIVNALKQQRESLRDVTLLHTFYEWVENFGDDNSAMDPVVFTDFSALRRLELALPFVFGQQAVRFSEGTARGPEEAPSQELLRSTSTRLVDALPSDIEEIGFAELECVRAAQILDNALSYLLERKDEVCPRLQKITVSFQKDDAMVLAKALARSLQSAKTMGIRLDFEAQKIEESGCQPLEPAAFVDLLELATSDAASQAAEHEA